MELWVQILELNENGEYCPVEVIPAKDVHTGGIFQLRQVRWKGGPFAKINLPGRMQWFSTALSSSVQ